MDKYILRRVPDEYVCNYFDQDFGDEIVNSGIVITGNRNYRDCGDKTLIDIIRHDYQDDDTDYDYDVFEELEKITGKKYRSRTMRGYSQGEWQDIYFPENEVADFLINDIENSYMGKFSEYMLDGGEDDLSTFYVPHDVEWKGKRAICEYCELDPEETTVLVDDGYHKEYNYKELTE